LLAGVALRVGTLPMEARTIIQLPDARDMDVATLASETLPTDGSLGEFHLRVDFIGVRPEDACLHALYLEPVD
jgi:hypothetical protein